MLLASWLGINFVTIWWMLFVAVVIYSVRDQMR